MASKSRRSEQESIRCVSAVQMQQMRRRTRVSFCALASCVSGVDGSGWCRGTDRAVDAALVAWLRLAQQWCASGVSRCSQCGQPLRASKAESVGGAQLRHLELLVRFAVQTAPQRAVQARSCRSFQRATTMRRVEEWRPRRRESVECRVSARSVGARSGVRGGRGRLLRREAVVAVGVGVAAAAARCSGCEVEWRSQLDALFCVCARGGLLLRVCCCLRWWA